MIPCLFLIGGLLLSLVTAWIDEAIHVTESNAPFFGETVENARAVVSSVPGATLTFIGVVFSVALVALQLRSNQYSPRVLRGFVRARTSKVTLGIYLATFAYSYLTLAGFDTVTPNGLSYVPLFSVLVCELLTLTSLVVFVLFVNQIIRSMRAAYIIDDIARETSRAIETTFPTTAPPSVPRPALTDDGGEAVPACRSGVIAAIDLDAAATVAGRHGVVVEMLVPVGAYIAHGETIARTHGGALDARALDRCLAISRERTLYQDPAYGLRQIVDIAIRALSPAVNDPTTAVQALDRLTGLLLLAGGRHEPEPVLADDAGSPRVLLDPPTFDGLCSLAYDEIRRYGADSPQIPRRMFDAFDTLRRETPRSRHDSIERQRRLLHEAIDRSWAQPDERSVVAMADRLGLG